MGMVQKRPVRVYKFGAKLSFRGLPRNLFSEPMEIPRSEDSTRNDSYGYFVKDIFHFLNHAEITQDLCVLCIFAVEILLFQ